jgi:hypothetical protein
VSDCLGKHAIGLCNWNLDIVSPCFDFIEDIFRLCETANEDNLLWVKIKVKASKRQMNATHINGPINCSGSLRNAIEYLLDEGVEEAEHIISKSVHENCKAIKYVLQCSYLESFSRPPWTARALSVSLDPSSLIKAS